MQCQKIIVVPKISSTYNNPVLDEIREMMVEVEAGGKQIIIVPY